MLIRTLATGAIAGVTALASCAAPKGAASGGPAGGPSAGLGDLPPPETTTLRIVSPAECCPALWLAQDNLREEGFTDISYFATPFVSRHWLTRGLADISLSHPEFLVAAIDAGLPATVLAALHSGCLELWVNPALTSVGDLRGKRLSVRVADTSDQFFTFFATLLGYVGIDPLKDVTFVESGPDEYVGMLGAFKEGRADAVLAGGGEGPQLRRLKTPGRVILATTMDKPWSLYGCCHLVANRDWALQNPVATKRLTRAILRSTDTAAKDHARAARDSVRAAAARPSTSGGRFKDESIVVETMGMCTYNWRELDPEETLRFFGLRLAEAKLINRTPKQLIEAGTDLLYMRQLRSELKS